MFVNLNVCQSICEMNEKENIIATRFTILVNYCSAFLIVSFDCLQVIQCIV